MTNSNLAALRTDLDITGDTNINRLALLNRISKDNVSTVIDDNESYTGHDTSTHLTHRETSPTNIKCGLDTPKIYNDDINLKPRTNFVVLQEWEGHVTKIDGQTFTARLRDLSSVPETENEEADFSIDEISYGEPKLLKLGAILRWSIGYQKSPGGTTQRVSRVIFRHLPAVTKQDLENAALYSRELSSSIKVL